MSGRKNKYKYMKAHSTNTTETVRQVGDKRSHGWPCIETGGFGARKYMSRLQTNLSDGYVEAGLEARSQIRKSMKSPQREKKWQCEGGGKDLKSY